MRHTNQVFHCTRCITPNRATNLRGPSSSYCARATTYFEEMPQRLRAVGNTVSDLTGPRFEPQTSRSKDELVSARPTTIIDYNGGVCWRTKNVLKIESFAFFDNSRFMITE